MSAWAKATNRDGKVPRSKISRRKRVSKTGKRRPKTAPISNGRKSDQLAHNIAKNADDADVTTSSALMEKGIKAINVIRKDALLNALQQDPSTESIEQVPGKIQDNSPPCEANDAVETQSQNTSIGTEKPTVSSPTFVKNELLDSLKEQIAQKKVRKEKERQANLEYERSIQKDAHKYDYFFGGANRGGGGTPVRLNGHAVANLKLIGKDLVTVQSPRRVSLGNGVSVDRGHRARQSKSVQSSKTGMDATNKQAIMCSDAPTPSKNFTPQQSASLDTDEKAVDETVEGRTPDRTLTPQEQYFEDLKKQIALKKLRKEKEEQERIKWELKKDKEMLEFNPFGRGGNGAPIKDKSGKIVANLRVLGRDLVTINREAYGTKR